MDVGTDDLLAIVTPIRDRLGEGKEIMDAHGTHMIRLRIVAEKTNALIARGSVERAEWAQIADDHLEAAIACYDDLQKLETLYSDIAKGISRGVGGLK